MTVRDQSRKQAIAAVAGAFWHRTRKVFVPLTLDELLARCGLENGEMLSATRDLSLRKWIKSQPDKATGRLIYELTPLGISSAFKAKKGGDA